ncbi:MAG: hypothetical protein IH996_09015 [Proteobacteria bacterium]|nr:hypothetical protein [Pseudomonadota bacterium]
MAQDNEPLKESTLPAPGWVQEFVETYLSWLPDWLEPYAIEFIVILALLFTLFAIAKKGHDLWRWTISALTSLWCRATGKEQPKSEAQLAAEAAHRAEKVSQQTIQGIAEIKDLLTARAKQAEQRGANIPADAIERADVLASEVQFSNDPSKVMAREALREGDLQAAENALVEAFNREHQAAKRLGDQTTQLKAKAARTAREKAALAAIRSASDALRWYRKAAELDPEDFRTQIELARLHRATGSLDDSTTAARNALQMARDERDRSVALDEFGDVLVAQGDLAGALNSYQASLLIRQRLARADESNAGLQRDLSVSYERIGDLQELLGEIAAAVEVYEASLVIAQSLAERFPDHRQFQSDVIITNRRLAELRAKLQ